MPEINDMTSFSRSHRERRLIKGDKCFRWRKIQDILEKYPRDPFSVELGRLSMPLGKLVMSQGNLLLLLLLLSRFSRV